MRILRSWKSLKILFFSSIIVLTNCEIPGGLERQDEVAKLPHCVDEEDVGYVLVSTLDGKLSALNANGNLAWEVDTGSGPLLHSSIHNVELTNQGELVRIIPSLSGSLYKFNGKTIDAIPINADTLLKSSFVYSSDTVIAGRRDVKTYGVVARTGAVLYECSSDGCRNITQTSDEFDDIIVIERSTATVRAHEPRTGQERWNFSVGYHNIKIPPASCINLDSAITSLNITAVLPDGVISASRKATYEQLWQHVFKTPIVKIWKWDGRDLYAVDVFANSPPRNSDQFALTLSPAIYLGMHNQQLYIHESIHMLSALQKLGSGGSTEVTETKSWTSFPWKPVPAGQLQGEVDDATAISVLYSSNYVDGNGYYFYTEIDRKKTIFCESMKNNTTKFFNRFENGSVIKTVLVTIGFVLLTAFVTQFKNIYNWFNGRVEYVELSESKERKTSSTKSEFESVVTDLSSTTTVSSVYNDARPPQSHFLENFDIICQLGKGGYGVVFEVKQKIDYSHYAVKIIPLPQRPVAKERVLREVVALARLDHPNIVRYSTSWPEKSLPDFKASNLGQALDDASLLNTDIYEEETDDEENDHNDSCYVDEGDQDDDFIVFSNDSKESTRSNSTRITVQTQTSIECACENQSRVLHESISIDDSDSDISKNNNESRSLLQSTDGSISTRHKDRERESDKKSGKDKGKERSYLFIQMQLCDKMTLKDWMRDTKERPSVDIYAIYQQILQAVDYIHSKQLIHRDLKPSNIFFNANCTPAQIKVGDFGLVTPMQNAGADRSEHVKGSKCGHTRDAGTALYMSPEQKLGSDYNYKVDVFSLGVILFELLVYFGTEGERIDMLIKLRSGRFPDNFQNDNPKEFTLLKAMLSSEAEERPTVSEVTKQISTFIPENSSL